MRRSTDVKWGSLRVGLLLIFAMAVVMWASLTGGGTSIFESKAKYHSYFRNVGGMVIGSPVWMSGVEVGNVSSVKFVHLDSVRQVKVTYRVLKSVKPSLTGEAYVTIGTIGFLGDKYIEIMPGSVGDPEVEEGSELPSKDGPDAAALFEAGENAFDKAGTLVTNLDGVLKRMNTGEGTLGQLSTDDQLYLNLSKLLANLTELVADMRKDQERVVKSLERASKATATLAEQASDSTGSLGRFLHDPSMYDNLAATSAQLDSVMAKINSAEGSAGLLVNDTALYVEMTNLMTRVNNLVTDIQENPRDYFKFSVF
jgi:phospholipid/cholesterol/gamma-HCH transport system substrate-binding protein